MQLANEIPMTRPPPHAQAVLSTKALISEWVLCNSLDRSSHDERRVRGGEGGGHSKLPSHWNTVPLFAMIFATARVWLCTPRNSRTHPQGQNSMLGSVALVVYAVHFVQHNATHAYTQDLGPTSDAHRTALALDSGEYKTFYQQHEHKWLADRDMGVRHTRCELPVVFSTLFNTRANVYSELELGPRFLPGPTTTLTKRLLYWIRLLARPVFFFFFSCGSTLGVWPFTLPARASEPCTLPASRMRWRRKSKVRKHEDMP